MTTSLSCTHPEILFRMFTAKYLVLAPFALLLYSCQTTAPTGATELVKADYAPIVQRAKETSLYSKEVNWEEVNEHYQELSADAQTVDDLKPALE